MNDRRGEKRGWYGGLLGGSVWMLSPIVYWLFQRRYPEAIVAIVLAASEVAMVFYLAPWKRPTVPYWRLYLPPVAANLLLASLAMAFEGVPPWSLDRWRLVLFAPLFFLPLFTVGGRTWETVNGAKPKPSAHPLD